MKRYSFCIIILLGILCIFNNPANALTIVDPDLYGNETPISDLFTGVTLRAIGSAVLLPVYSLDSPPPFNSTGIDKVFGNEKNNDSGFFPIWEDQPSVPGPFQNFRADFDNLVNFVSAVIIPTGPTHRAILEAFDSSNNFLDSYTTSSGMAETASISRSNFDIRYITIANPVNIQFAEPFLIDNLKFHPTPIPATALLLGPGLLGLVVLRRMLNK